MNENKHLKNIITNLLLLIISFFSIFLTLEISVRLIYHSPSGTLQYMVTADDALCFKWNPNFTGTITAKEYTTELKINEEGFRDESYEHISGKKIIFSVGDSMTAAQQVPLEKTFTKLLQQKLGTNYFVMNVGVPGYNPSQYHILLEQMLRKYKPQIILLNFFISNDFIPSKKDFRKNKCEFTVISGYEINADYEKKGTLFNIRMFFARYSQLYNLVSDLINRNYWIKKILTHQGIILSPFYPEDFIFYDEKHSQYTNIYETTFELIKEINSLAKKHQIPIIILILPAEYHVKEELFEEIKEFYKLPEEIHFSDAYEKLTNFLKKEKILFINMRAILSKNKEEELYFKHDKHFTQKAHEIIAESTQSFLKTHLLATKDKDGNTTITQRPQYRYNKIT